MNIRSAQWLVWQQKLATGLNTADVPLEFCLLNAEVASAHRAWHEGEHQVAGALADIAIILFGLAAMLGAELQDEVEAKLTAAVAHQPGDTAP